MDGFPPRSPDIPHCHLFGALVAGLSGFAFGLLRGLPKDQQRAVFQPVAVATFVMTAIWIGAKGAITTDTIRLFLLGLPALLAVTWLGMKLYGRLDEAKFRKLVLALLLLSGAVLIY
jgi:uncharacterized protein